MVPEAQLKSTEHGREPAGDGWFIVNAREAKWLDGEFGAYTRFEGESRFPKLGLNIGVLHPGQAACYYHGEDNQEDFLVLAGECLLLIEGEERRLRQWDFVHCPPETSHIIVGAGDGPCLVLAVGSRRHQETEGWGAYTVDPVAVRHGAGVEAKTADARTAYARFPAQQPTRYRDGWLPSFRA